MFTRFLFCSFLVLTLISSTQAQSVIRMIHEKSVSDKIDSFLQNPDPFSMSNSTFEKAWMPKYAMEWTDKFQRSARSTNRISFGELISNETIFKFRSKKFNSIKMMVFNQGDQGRLSETNFNKMVEATVKKVTDIVGSEPNFKPNAGATSTNIYFWVKMPYLYKVEYSSSTVKANKFATPEFKAEYIRVVVSQGDKRINAVNIDKVGNEILTQLEIKEMITKDSEGNVFLEGIPMIDQGSKGYCACATTARVLNYYGREIDMHDVAKLTESSAMGTDPDELKKALTTISSKLRLNMQTIVKCYLSSYREVNRLITKLDRQYKSMDMKFNPSHVISSEIKPAFKEMALKDRRFKDFVKGIKTYIDRGQPLVWGLMLGIVPEDDIPQARGGHMRIINGYNLDKNIIYYSDSWGKGHERKSMDIYTAYYISMAVWSISPR